MDSSERFLVLSRFWIQRVLVPILVCIGAGGNIVTVMVLTRRRMRCSTNIYLTALAVADLIYLLFVLILSFEHYPNIHDIRHGLYWRFYGINHWLADAASSASIWLVVCFTIERYIAVCHPIRGKFFCTENRAKCIIATVSILCLLSTMSTSFEYQLSTSSYCIQKTCDDVPHMNTTKFLHLDDNLNITIGNQSSTNHLKFHKKRQVANTDDNKDYLNYIEEEEEDMPPETNLVDTVLENYPDEKFENCTSLNDTNVTECDNSTAKNITAEEECCVKSIKIETEPTHLGENALYKAVFYWFTSITFTFLPLTLIATFNCFLVNAVRKSQIKRKQMTRSQENTSQAQENRMTVILISVVILFLICQTPTACMLIYRTMYPSLDEQTDNLVRGLGNIFNFLVLINASCNFLLYCALSDKYRRTFKALFCGRRLLRQETIATSQMSRRTNSSQKNGIRRNVSAYVPRNYESQSLTNSPRSKTMIVRPPDKRDTVKLV